MKTELKDVLHLYLGCEIKSTLMGLQHKFTDFNFKTLSHFEIGNFKLILRPLSDMTADEVNYKNKLCRISEINVFTSDGKKAIIMHDSPNNFLWLLKNGFDLFGLIESGQAIDKTKL